LDIFGWKGCVISYGEINDKCIKEEVLFLES